MSIRRQRPVKGRIPRAFGALPALHRQIEQIAARFNVSKSFVIAVALADQFGIADQERFDDRPARLSVVKRRRSA
jgi:hypothetical protein